MCNYVRMKLSAWAKQNGLSYRTALTWFHDGTLPVPARRMPSGTILVEDHVSIFGEPCPACGRPINTNEHEKRLKV